MKRFLILGLTLILSWNGFSQNATVIDTTGIVLPTEVARKVAIELVEKDEALEEIQVLKDIVRFQDTIISIKDSTIFCVENKVEVQTNYISIMEQEMKAQEESIKQLEKAVSKQKAWKTVFQTTTGCAVIGLIISLLI